MKSVYKQTKLIITEFDTEDVIATSAVAPPEPPVVTLREKDNRHISFGSFEDQPPGGWF